MTYREKNRELFTKITQDLKTVAVDIYIWMLLRRVEVIVSTPCILKMCPLSINSVSKWKKKEKRAVQWVQRRWTCHHVDIPAIRGTFSGAVAGSLQCLPKSIISQPSHSLKMSYIHSNELWEHVPFPNLPTAVPTLIQVFKLCNSSPSTH